MIKSYIRSITYSLTWICLNIFLMLLELLYSVVVYKLILTFVLGDFDPRSNNWCRNDTTSHQGSMIDVVTSN